MQKTRRSTFGGVLFHGSHCLGHWSKTQPVVAFSSGGTELNAALKGGSEILGTQGMLQETGDPKTAKAKIDSGLVSAWHTGEVQAELSTSRFVSFGYRIR